MPKQPLSGHLTDHSNTSAFLIEENPTVDPRSVTFLNPPTDHCTSDEDPGTYIEKYLAKIVEPVAEKETAGPSTKPKAKRKKGKKRPWTKPSRPQQSKTQAVVSQPIEKSAEAPKNTVEDPLSDGSPVLNTVRKRFVLHDSDSDTPLVTLPPNVETKVAGVAPKSVPPISQLVETTRKESEDNTVSAEEIPILVPESETVAVTTDVGETDPVVPAAQPNATVSEKRLTSAADALNSSKALLELNVDAGHTDEESELYQKTYASRAPLSVSSRTLIRECFSSNPVVTLPSGHATVALTEMQLGSLVQAVSEESAHINFRTMKDILLKASNLRPLVERKPKPSDKFRRTVPLGDVTSSSADESVGESVSSKIAKVGKSKKVPCVTDTSSGENSDKEGRQSVVQRRPLKSRKPEFTANVDSSEDDAALSSFRAQAPGTSKQAPSGSPRKRVNPGRPGKVMKESCFQGQEWTRVFATGPIDPENNQFRFYCQICKYNVSMYSKGKGELKRHYRRESHLRKDQRWRYEHLRIIDPYSKVSTPMVRDKHGVLLKGVALEAEMPLFINEELVELGPKFPFYEDFIMGRNPTQTSAETKATVQLSVFIRFLHGSGNLPFLRSFWNSVGAIINHQTAFDDIEWTLQEFSVIILCYFSES